MCVFVYLYRFVCVGLGGSGRLSRKTRETGARVRRGSALNTRGHASSVRAASCMFHTLPQPHLHADSLSHAPIVQYISNFITYCVKTASRMARDDDILYIHVNRPNFHKLFETIEKIKFN